MILDDEAEYLFAFELTWIIDASDDADACCCCCCCWWWCCWCCCCWCNNWSAFAGECACGWRMEVKRLASASASIDGARADAASVTSAWSVTGVIEVIARGSDVPARDDTYDEVATCWLSPLPLWMSLEVLVDGVEKLPTIESSNWWWWGLPLFAVDVLLLPPPPLPLEPLPLPPPPPVTPVEVVQLSWWWILPLPLLLVLLIALEGTLNWLPITVAGERVH